MVSSVLVTLCRNVRDGQWCDKFPSKSFFYDSVGVWEVRKVGEGREAVWTNDSIQFGLGFALGVWIQDHREEKGLKG